MKTCPKCGAPQADILPTCDLCGSQEGLQRSALKAFPGDLERRFPGRKDTIARSLSTVKPSHLLDPALFDFAGLQPRPLTETDPTP